MLAQWKTTPPAKYRDTRACFIHCQLHSSSNGFSTCLICRVSARQSHRRGNYSYKALWLDWKKRLWRHGGCAGGNISWHLARQQSAVREGTGSVAPSLRSAGVLSAKWCLKLHKETRECMHKTHLHINSQSDAYIYALTHTHTCTEDSRNSSCQPCTICLSVCASQPCPNRASAESVWN